MSVEQQQTVASLRYFLYDRPLHPELFTIHADDHLCRKAYEARLWVTGCSHVISVKANQHCLTEVLADTHCDLPERGRLVEMPLRGEKEHDTHDDPLRYTMNFQLEQMSERVFANTHAELTRLGQTRGLFVPFPDWMSRPPLTPFSYLDYEARARHLHVFAYHAFPADLTLIKVQCIFDVA